MTNPIAREPETESPKFESLISADNVAREIAKASNPATDYALSLVDVRGWHRSYELTDRMYADALKETTLATTSLEHVSMTGPVHTALLNMHNRIVVESCNWRNELHNTFFTLSAIRALMNNSEPFETRTIGALRVTNDLEGHDS